MSTGRQQPVEEIRTSDLMPYVNNTQRPYVTAYLKADDMPTEFVIGDGNEYNSEKANYANQPLEENASYSVFLRYFESKVSRDKYIYGKNYLILRYEINKYFLVGLVLLDRMKQECQDSCSRASR